MKTTKIINISNHPSDNWDIKQKKINDSLVRIVDIKFPDITGNNDIDIISINKIVDEIIYYSKDEASIFIAGDFWAVSSIKNILIQKDIFVDFIYPFSKRDAIEKDGKKISVFTFIKWRSEISPFISSSKKIKIDAKKIDIADKYRDDQKGYSPDIADKFGKGYAVN